MSKSASVYPSRSASRFHDRWRHGEWLRREWDNRGTTVPFFYTMFFGDATPWGREVVPGLAGLVIRVLGYEIATGATALSVTVVRNAGAATWEAMNVPEHVPANTTTAVRPFSVPPISIEGGNVGVVCDVAGDVYISIWGHYADLR